MRARERENEGYRERWNEGESEMCARERENEAYRER